MNSYLQLGRFKFDLKRPLIMGIVNVTPDSFSDGNRHFSTEKAIKHGLELISQGADILDIGGESTRPGAHPVSVDEEASRIIPVIEALSQTGVPISVDTFKPEVMALSLEAGADMINDITGFNNPKSISVVVKSNCALCVMHMQGEPRTMQKNPVYENVLTDVKDFLQQRVNTIVKAGISKNRIVTDPGFGFGKTQKQNYHLLRNLSLSCPSGYPILLGVSRKSMIGHVTGRDAANRQAGSIAAALAGVHRGANIIRVHDVQYTCDALKVWLAAEHGSYL